MPELPPPDDPPLPELPPDPLEPPPELPPEWPDDPPEPIEKPPSLFDVPLPINELPIDEMLPPSRPLDPMLNFPRL